MKKFVLALACFGVVSCASSDKKEDPQYPRPPEQVLRGGSYRAPASTKEAATALVVTNPLPAKEARFKKNLVNKEKAKTLPIYYRKNGCVVTGQSEVDDESTLQAGEGEIHFVNFLKLDQPFKEGDLTMTHSWAATFIPFSLLKRQPGNQRFKYIYCAVDLDKMTFEDIRYRLQDVLQFAK
ncbi:hypothetical protein ACLWBD_03910 [Bdellovibrio sp. HCB117]|uniref:hypothetical protein n=1 Tax=Bdellovibrio sp. HCB117 TaxID=3394359 RepID=UPI0039B5870C